eukprot:TRINITY_DN2217_c0_g1_i1.p1 TRINITY_DN2217_c0_g1~~TRINITY_DN2217_c0_g1_i1.p1  ORF type:complete len:121 (-),score=6.45 TRINITY_DN2217_c0_g1_i1:112-474(-)
MMTHQGHVSGAPTLSRGMRRNSEPCLRKTLPALCCGLIPTPSLVIIALVWGGTWNSSAANFRTAVNGAASGTLNTLNGSFGSDARVTLNDTFPLSISNFLGSISNFLGFRDQRERERETN